MCNVLVGMEKALEQYRSVFPENDITESSVPGYLRAKNKLDEYLPFENSLVSQCVARGGVHVARGGVGVARGGVHVARGGVHVARGGVRVTWGGVARGGVHVAMFICIHICKVLI